METLRIASCMAPNADPTCRAIAQFIARKLDLPVEVVDAVPWEERERLLDAGDVHLCWLCGLPYVAKVDRADPPLDLCAAPVMRDARYQDRPIYYSDVVVRRSSGYRCFADLRGSAWAYNEPNSHSGHNVVRYHLARVGATEGYFRSAIESGAHQQSLRMILDRAVDASAIDSTVLEAELRRDPALRNKIAVIETLGPSPMPPWVMASSLPPQLRMALRSTLLTMHHDAEGSGALVGWGISHFTSIDDTDYDPIRHMAIDAKDVRLTAP